MELEWEGLFESALDEWLLVTEEIATMLRERNEIDALRAGRGVES